MVFYHHSYSSFSLMHCPIFLYKTQVQHISQLLNPTGPRSPDPCPLLARNTIPHFGNQTQQVRGPVQRLFPEVSQIDSIRGLQSLRNIFMRLAQEITSKFILI